MKKINLKGISTILSQKEMKNVMGGSGSGIYRCPDGFFLCHCHGKTTCASFVESCIVQCEIMGWG